MPPETRPAREPWLALPAGVDPWRYYVGLLGPVALGLSVGLQVMMTAFVGMGPAQDQGPREALTFLGRSIIFYEHDLPLYAAGLVLVLLLMGAAVYVWRGMLLRVGAEEAARFAIGSCVMLAGLAVLSFGAYLVLLAWYFPVGRGGIRELASANSLILRVPAAAAVLCAFLDLRSWSAGLGAGTGAGRGRARLGLALDVGVPLAVILIVFVPVSLWNVAAGKCYMADSLHHWNFFAMGPALSFLHGEAFGTDFYSQYGVGWPLVFAALSKVLAPTYGNMIGMGVVYGVVYYLGVYLLLRLFLGEAAWAAVGALLAIWLQMFHGQGAGQLPWLCPSSLMLRHSMDVWFFLALLMHLRSGRMPWLGLAGLACGLGVVFETDTGLYLLVTFLFYWLLAVGLPQVLGRPVRWKALLGPALSFLAAAVVVVLAVLLVASRGTLLTGAFWSGWLEPLRTYSSGMGQMPIAGVDDTAVLLFLSIVAVYLLTIGYVVLRCLHRAAGPDGIWMATVSAYGLLLLMIFVGRSHPFNLYHPLVPFAVVVTGLLWKGLRLGVVLLERSVFPYVVASALGLLLLADPHFQEYPSLLSALLNPSPPRGLALVADPEDIAGLPDEAQPLVDLARSLSGKVRQLASDGSEVVILDESDTLFYYAGGIKPWSRYASLLHTLTTRDTLRRTEDELLARRPAYAVIRALPAGPPPRAIFADVRAALHALLERHYVLETTVGPYEIWRFKQ